MLTQNMQGGCKNFSSEMYSYNVVKHVITLDKPTKIQVVKALQIARAPIQCTVMRFLDLKETSTDMAADWIFEKFKLI